jgi:hypothetical protein
MRGHVMRKRNLKSLDADSARRSAYQEMLDTELGRNRRAQGHRDIGRPDGALDLLTRPTGLVILGILFFGLTFTVLLWRDGAFDKWLGPRSASIGTASKSWILGRGVRDRLEDTEPPPEEIAPEVMPEPAPAASGVPAPVAPAEPIADAGPVV